MGTPYLGEVRVFSFNFPPRGWAFCNGQLLSISQNTALFSLLGTIYGGNGVSTFALPNLQGCAPLHFGNNFLQGQAGGEQSHTLTFNELPLHAHFVNASGADANADTPVGNYLAQSVNFDLYSPTSANPTTLRAGTIGAAGGGQPHNNLQPYLTLNFCIALQGIFPSRN
jgi:microcystin-dependent protein